MFMKPRAVQIREKVMIPLVRVHQWMDTNLKIRGCLSIWNGRQQHNIKLKPTNAHTVVLGSNLNQKSIVNKVLQYEVTESLRKEVAEGGSAWKLCKHYYTYIHIWTQMMENMMLCCLNFSRKQSLSYKGWETLYKIPVMPVPLLEDAAGASLLLCKVLKPIKCITPSLHVWSQPQIVRVTADHNSCIFYGNSFE